MKALTLWQPWATLVIEGIKPYEFRGWRPPAKMIGQRIVIHAAARKVDWFEVIDLRRRLEMGGRLAAETCLRPTDRALQILRGPLPAGQWPLGHALGTAVIGEPRNGLDIAEEFGVPRANDSDRDEHANWGWPMLEIEPWTPLIPMRGAQGLWNWPEPEWAA